MSAAGPVAVALFGDRACELTLALSRTLRQNLPTQPLPQWLCNPAPAHWQQAPLRWLLDWQASPGDDANADISAVQAHSALRQALHAQGLSYQVLRGSPDDQAAQALASLRLWIPELAEFLPRTGVASRRPGALSCDRCGDPDCEHRSFTGLLARDGTR